jgi:hypothetical protein
MITVGKVLARRFADMVQDTFNKFLDNISINYYQQNFDHSPNDGYEEWHLHSTSNVDGHAVHVYGDLQRGKDTKYEISDLYCAATRLDSIIKNNIKQYMQELIKMLEEKIAESYPN